MSKKKMLKNFLNTTLYKPAKLHRTANRWFIRYSQTDPRTKKLVHFRKTFNLNRIPVLEQRQLEADKVLARINELLPKGYPYSNAKYEDRRKISIIKAVGIATKIKCNTDRPKSADVYATVSRIFLRYIDSINLSSKPIGDFSKIDAFDFFDYLITDRDIGNTTYNNYKTILSSLFNFLVNREYISENPFRNIPKKPKTEKKRRMYTPEERDIICSHVYATNKQLMLLILLEYHCFIRPTELARLQFHNFNIEKGIIELPASKTKNRKDATITIPDVIVPYLYEAGMDKHPSNWFVFGKSLQPSPNQLLRPHTYNDFHKRMLKKLVKTGDLKDMKGLTFYSWKDTGALDLLDAGINIMEVMAQLRHSDLSTTQRYLKKISKVNENIKLLKTVNLLPILTKIEDK